MIVAISGTRHVLTMGHMKEIQRTIEQAKSLGRVKEWRVGDCPTGVDAYIRDGHERIELDIVPLIVFYVRSDIKWPGAGPERNRRMLRGADLLLGFPDEGSRGTKDAIKQAMKANQETIVTWLR